MAQKRKKLAKSILKSFLRENDQFDASQMSFVDYWKAFEKTSLLDN
jgi:hypothetical protein